MSSATAASPKIEAPATKANPSTSSSPRKRRRRTAATGATEDCFTCRKRQVRCDRKRPYCTQCLEIGKDCSGYRTTLTWGVGVASRGKLRGLSLPIINSTKKAAAANEEEKCFPSPTSKPAQSPSKTSKPEFRPKSEDITDSALHNALDVRSAFCSPSGYERTSPIPIPLQPTRPSWYIPNVSEHAEEYSNVLSKSSRLHLRPTPLQRAYSTGMTSASYDESLFSAPSASSASTFSESDFPSPNDMPPTPESFAVVEPYVGSYSDRLSCPSEQMQQTHEAFNNFLETPRSYPATSSFPASAVNPATSQACFNMLLPAAGPTTFSEFFQCQDMTFGPPLPLPHKVEQAYIPDGFSGFSSVSDSSNWASSTQPTLEQSGFSNLPPRLQYLLRYYDESIAPILVACDDHNPYRMYVMRLAASSPALQNGIAALALNNIRHKGFKSSPKGFSLSAYDFIDTEALLQEESMYQAHCVNTFNDSLKDPMKATQDDVLATLLVQCLLHLSDGGLSKFRTQLAGVRRLMNMRAARNEFGAWVERWFVYFDIMSSTVGDRELQPRSDVLDALDLSANIGSLELLANCSGRLIKLIARLGHLNIAPPPAQPKADTFLLAPTTPNITPLSAKDFCNLDGNGWGVRIDTPISPASTVSSDAREEIWSQFLQVRTRLSNWVSQPTYKAASHVPASDAENATAFHIAELYRLAASLYSERLVCPSLPSSGEPVQSQVRAALQHLAATPLETSKFLLWPMLVVGSECIFHADRAVLRQRIPIAAQGFFVQHFTLMDVMEQVWACVDAGHLGVQGAMAVEGWPRLSSLGGQGVRWMLAFRAMGAWS